MFWSFYWRHPMWFSIMGMACYSLAPVLFVWGGAVESPFLYTGIWLVSHGVCAGIVYRFIHPSGRALGFNLAEIKNVTLQGMPVRMLLTVIGGCGLSLFALGLLFLNVAIVAILYEIRFLLLFVFILIPGPAIYYVPAIVGGVLVILSHNDTTQLLPALGADFADPGTLMGVILVLAAAVGWAIAGICTTKLAKLLTKKHFPPEHEIYTLDYFNTPDDLHDYESVYSGYITCISLVIAGGALCAFGLLAFETISLQRQVYAIMGGVVFSIGWFSIKTIVSYERDATKLNRQARVKGKDEADDFGMTSVLALQAVYSASPLVILILLSMFSILDVLHLDYLIIGAVGIVVSRLLIQGNLSERVAYQALTMALWLFGTITYFTTGIETHVPLELPVTIFILVLAFRVARLVRRTGQEEEWVLEVFHRLTLLASKKHIGTKASKTLRDASKSLLRIDRHKSAGELQAAYECMVGQLETAGKARRASDEVTDIRRLVDMLAHSRQQGSRFDEIVAIALTGGLIVMGLLVFNGNRDDGDSVFYSEFTSFLLSSVVVFLIFHILDLQKARKDETLIKHKVGRYIVKFESLRNRELELISVGISIVIVAVFGVLFTGVFKSI